MRPPDIDSDWEKVRIFTRPTLFWGGAPSGPFFALGLCSGISNPVHKTSSTAHFVGLLSTSMSYSSGRLYMTTYAAKRVATTNTTSGSSEIFKIHFPGTITSRTPIAIDITRGSPNFTIKVWGVDNTSTLFPDMTEDNFLDHIHSATPNWSQLISMERTLAVDEVTDGTLDHFNLGYFDNNSARFSFWTPGVLQLA